jgi:hypothetical protein
MPYPINIVNIYTGLERVLPLLPTAAVNAVSSLLRSAPPELLRLCFLPLHLGQSVEMRSYSLYAPAAGHQTPGRENEESDPAFWIVFEHLSLRGARSEVAAVIAAGHQEHSALSDLVNVLEAFHFFAPLTCTPEIRHCDPVLAQRITALQRLRTRSGAELHGEQLTVAAPVALGCFKPDTLHLCGLAPLDAPPSEYLQYLMPAPQHGHPPIVVLGERNITLVPDPTVKLTRKT